MSMTQAERRELRSVVKQQFKVLRAEVEQRRKELAAEAAAQVRRRYATADKTLDDLNWRVQQIVDQANKDIRDAVQAAGDPDDGGSWSWSGPVTAPRILRREETRHALTATLQTGIDAQVHQATLTLERQEADLVRQLTLGALESEEARSFLAAIPTVSELVPTSRLAELEAAFDEKRGER